MTRPEVYEKGKHNYSWKVLYDPLGVGSFDKGTLLPMEEVIHMLRYATFTLGTVLKHRSWGKFVVIAGKRPGEFYRLQNSKYMGIVVSGQKLKLVELDKQTRNVVVEVTA